MCRAYIGMDLMLTSWAGFNFFGGAIDFGAAGAGATNRPVRCGRVVCVGSCCSTAVLID